MIYQTILATKPGVPNPKLEKRTGDIKVFAIDCSALLVPNELVLGSVTVSTPSALLITDTKCREGKFILFRVAGGPFNTTYVEYSVSFKVTTSLSNIIEIPITIKVYS